jgi:hypothetical protein
VALYNDEYLSSLTPNLQKIRMEFQRELFAQKY